MWRCMERDAESGLERVCVCPCVGAVQNLAFLLLFCMCVVLYGVLAAVGEWILGRGDDRGAGRSVCVVYMLCRIC